MLKIATNLDVLKSMLLSPRFKSFYWFLGMMILSVILNTLLANIDIFAPYIGEETVILLGGILQQFSKAIANIIAGKDTGFLTK